MLKVFDHFLNEPVEIHPEITTLLEANKYMRWWMNDDDHFVHREVDGWTYIIIGCEDGEASDIYGIFIP